MTTVATPAEATTSYPRELVERVVALRLIAALLAVLCVLAVVAPSGATLYQLFALAPATIWCLWSGSEKLRNLPTGRARRAHWAVLGSYSASAIAAAWLSFGTWHSTSDRQFSGFERGGGSYSLVFAVVLAVAVAGLVWSEVRRPLDTALHVVALVCGTVFVGAAFAGSYSRGLAPLRLGILGAGILTVVVAAMVLRRRAGDPLSQQAYAAAVFSAGGALMAASSFMSWGEGNFLVNYRPGTTIGGFDGRFTALAGAAIMASWVAHFLFGRHDEARWRLQVRVSAALGFAGLVAVINSGSAESHPARALAAAACMVVLVGAAEAHSLRTSDQSAGAEATRARVFAGRVFAGCVAIAGAVLLSAGAAYLASLRLARVQVEVDYDDLVAAVSFGALGVALLRAAVGSARGRYLSAQAAAIVLGGLALVLLIPPDRASTHGLVMAAFFAGIAVLGVAADKWFGPMGGQDPIAKLRVVIRSKWLHALGGAVVTYAVLRWALPELIPTPEFDASEQSLEQWDETERTWAQINATRWAIALSLLALLTTKRRALSRSIAFTAVSAVLYAVFRIDVSDRFSLLSQSEESWIAELAVVSVAVTFYALGRGRFSAVALALVVAAGNPLLLDSLLFVVVPRSAYTVPVVREVMLAIPQTVQFFVVAVAFLAYPVGTEAQANRA